MKKQFFYLSTFIALAVGGVLSITQSSCSKQKDACASVVCQHNGTCADGTCTCPAGYSGANCETAFSAQFVGTYIGSDSASPPVVDTFIIAADTGAYGLTINSKRKNLTLRALVSGTTLTIPSQNVALGSFTESVTGAGAFNLPIASINFTENLNGALARTVFTGNKQ